MSHIQPERYSKANNTQTVHAHPIFMRLNNFMASSILDIGSGDGKLTSKLKGLYPESQVIGIDISQEMVSYAKKNYANIDFMQADATKLATIGQFDLITCFSTAHWIEDQYALFSKVKQNLKNGGRFLGFLYPVCKIQLSALQQVIELKRYSQYFSRAFESPYFDHQVETYQQIFDDLNFKINHLAKSPTEFVLYKSKKDFTDFIGAWLPHVNNIPNHLRCEFLDEFTDLYRRNVTSLHKHACPDSKGCFKIPFNRIEIDIIK